jgi:transcriptional regulator with XRE-family HTH domain
MREAHANIHASDRPPTLLDLFCLQGIAPNAYQIARAVGLPETSVRRWLSGRSFPQGPSLRRLSAFLGVSRADVLAAILASRGDGEA